jgi:hypothetical protein
MRFDALDIVGHGNGGNEECKSLVGWGSEKILWSRLNPELPDNNYCGYTWMIGYGDEWQTLARYNIAPPKGSKLINATMGFYPIDFGCDSYNISLYEVPDSSWSCGSITYNNAPAHTTQWTIIKNMSKDILLDVTNATQEYWDSGYQYMTFKFISGHGLDCYFEGNSMKPQNNITVCYQNAGFDYSDLARLFLSDLEEYTECFLISKIPNKNMRLELCLSK